MPLELADLPDLENYQANDPASALLAAEETVRGFCGWHIAPSRDETYLRTARARSVIVLPTLYLTDVASITEDTAPAVLTDFTWEPNGVITRTRWPWWAGYFPVTTVEVEFTHGYDETPADLKAVVLALANRAIDSPGTLVRVGQVQYSNDTDAFTTAEVDVLRRYRIPRLA